MCVCVCVCVWYRIKKIKALCLTKRNEFTEKKHSKLESQGRK